MNQFSSNSSGLSPLQKIDALCDQFEAELQNPDESPSIRDYLDCIEERHRPELFKQLMRLELQLDSQPPVESYHQRYPEFRSIIDEVFVSSETIVGTKTRDTASSTSRTMGPYRILQPLGEGGMGAVFLADQTTPVKRRVALKLIKPGMDSKQIIARFEAERQALAMMNHPNIAKVLDAGTTEDGRPYFAMELVQGIQLTDYCDRQKLSTEARLELFVSICDAIQHAHQKGVIHRDIKPSNVLVTEQAGRPVPKVIDFGLAKALHTRLTDRTMFTHINQAVGTLQYMSPEQTEANALDVDTRSDVYSLGAMLYELLTGTTPLEKDTLKSAAFDRVLQLIRDWAPPKPSTRLHDSKEAATICQVRQSDPRQLSHLLKGDLDWIIMKALEKDRNRRYETVNALSDDIRRFLSNEPVSARPPSATYKIGKFIRKNRVAVITASVIACLLLATSSISTTLYIRAKEAQSKEMQMRIVSEASKKKADEARIAADRLREEAEKARSVAVASAQTAQAQANSADEITDFLHQMFKRTRPSFLFGISEKPTDPRSRVERIREDYRDNPKVQAQLMGVIGDAHLGMSQVVQAAPYLLESLDIRLKNLPDDDLLVAESYYRLAKLRMFQGNNDEGIKLARNATSIREKHLGDKDSQTLAARGLRLFGEIGGKYTCDKAKRVVAVRQMMAEWKEIYEIRKEQLKDEHGRRHHPDLAKLKLILGTGAGYVGDQVEALRHVLSAVTMLGNVPDDENPGRILEHYANAKIAERFNRLEERNRSLQRAANEATRLFHGNDNNPLSLELRRDLVEGLLKDAIQIRQKASGNPDQDSAAVELKRAERIFDELRDTADNIVDGCRRTYGDVPRTAEALRALSINFIHGQNRDVDKSIQMLEEAIDILTRTYGETHFRVAEVYLFLGRRYNTKRLLERSAHYYRECLRICRETDTIGYGYLDNFACSELSAVAKKLNQVNATFLKDVQLQYELWLKNEPNNKYVKQKLADLQGEFAKSRK